MKRKEIIQKVSRREHPGRLGAGEPGACAETCHRWPHLHQSAEAAWLGCLLGFSVFLCNGLRHSVLVYLSRERGSNSDSIRLAFTDPESFSFSNFRVKYILNAKSSFPLPLALSSGAHVLSYCQT